MTPVPKVNNTDKIDYDKIPDNTVTVIMKSGGKIYSKGLTLPVLNKDTPDEDVVMSMQRVRDISTMCIDTIFYKLKGHGKNDIKPELVDVAPEEPN